MHACLLWHMAANWTVTLLSCVHCAFGTHGLKQPPENVSGVCLQLARPWSKQVLDSLMIHVLSLASSDHQENYWIGISYWDMICNSNNAKIQLGFLTYHTRVLFCLGESCPPKKDRKPGWIEIFRPPLFLCQHQKADLFLIIQFRK